MLYSPDLEIALLAVNLIKEDPEFNWIYLQASDEVNYFPNYDIEYFKFFGVTDIDVIMLHRVRFIIADVLRK
jgi:hypothetical protein